MNLAIAENVSLKPFNTFGIDVKARYLFVVKEISTLQQALLWAKNNDLAVTVIGGGSNIVFTKDIDGLVLLLQTQGIEIIKQQDSVAIVEVAAGVVWHELVRWSVAQGLGGIENLSLIYGTVGAAPVQNIGAYGIEFKDVCHLVQALHRKTGDLHTFTTEQCCFSYRDSLFKHQPEQWIITKVQIKLDYKAPIHIGYAALQQSLPEQTDQLSYAQVSDLVIKTRQQRLPDPKQIGNAGSFFKNPIVSLEKAKQLQQHYPDLVTYPYDNDHVKLAAGWLIDKAGLKGIRDNEVGTYPLQALVLVNYGKATGLDILAFSQKIQATVKQKFGIELEPEPVIL
ncbi:UDP-N-acetylmuramate dehydrogenase [Entomomonas asaccharolytica]|uniref:UDP-N-acetylenolpyruvoylglucosamine reductase n=1 Tax=Entomomonas asaccharolytica TaxID=2785331 RepID=A0A974NEU8_9GAMM|nr:UDP-N-acetylmuramate dehydrogenase [Entomomonas asaccharolytica]QQP85127.1 UDP-N-acetylmuramate dehydrogenase [Entomomonas asaccharolytica]